MGNEDGARALAKGAFENLFGERHFFVEGLGGNHAANVIAHVILQLVTDDPACVTVVSTARATVQTMVRMIQEPVPVVFNLTNKKHTNKPVLPLFREHLGDPCLDVSGLRIVTSDRVGDIRLGHHDKRAKMQMLAFDDAAVGPTGVELYRSAKAQFTLATPDDMPLIRAGKSPIGRITSRRQIGNAWITTVDIPTLMIYELRPCKVPHGCGELRTTNFRFGMNFSPGGETVLTMGTKVSDLERYLEFFDPEWESAICQQLVGT